MPEEKPRDYSWLLVGGLILLIIAGTILLFYRQVSDGADFEIVFSTPSPTPPPQIRVYVSGAVNNPGVYTFLQGDRVEDALKAAGGTTSEADLARVNLALRLKDEQQIYVPKVGETAVSPLASEGTAKININTASATILQTLPGIGAVRSEDIVNHRNKNGPFKRIEDLRDLKLIPSSTFEKIKDLITVE